MRTCREHNPFSICDSCSWQTPVSFRSPAFGCRQDEPESWIMALWLFREESGPREFGGLFVLDGPRAAKGVNHSFLGRIVFRRCDI